MAKKIVAVVGMCGSGKSTVSEELIKLGWGYVRFGQLTIDTLKERELSVNEKSERSIREELRKKHGMDAFASLNIKKFDAVLKNKNLIADGLYSWSEYKYLKNYYKNRLVVVAIFSPPEIRYKRLAQRKPSASDTNLINRVINKEDAMSRDYAEIENMEKGGPIAMANYTILNIGSKKQFITEIKKIIKQLC